MSTKPRFIISKKPLLNEVQRLHEALNSSDERLQEANKHLEAIEEGYVRYKKEVKSVTDKNLFKGLYAAFILWRGERRG